MHRLLLTGVGLVLVLYLLPVFYPSETDKTEPQAPTESVTAAATDGLTITVLVNGKAQEMPLETYVEGVTAAEIADDFPVEAIRAQAVAARTYAVYKQSRGRPAEHPDADVCDDYSHCAAYQPDAVKTFSTGYSRIRKAVKDTAGQILTCDGAPIAAVFHCVSGPKTESAADVWGEDIPYLQSVVSPGGTQYAGYESEVTLTADAFREKVAQALPKADVSGTPDRWFASSVRSAAGGVKTVKLGGVTVEEPQCGRCLACSPRISPSQPPRTVLRFTPSDTDTVLVCRSTVRNTWRSRDMIIPRYLRITTRIQS